MTDSSTTPDAQIHKPYNFVLGALASLLAVPLTVIVTIVIGQFGFEYSATFGGLGMVFAFTFFGSASRRRIVRGLGFAFALLVGLIATSLGVIAGFVSSVYYSFNAVGGKGGLLGDVFIGRIVYRLTERPEDFFIPAAIAAFLAIMLLVKYMKTASAVHGTPADAVGNDAAAAPTTSTTPATPATPAPSETVATATPELPDAAATTINAPSSGILLNGKPLGEPEPKKRFWQ